MKITRRVLLGSALAATVTPVFGQDSAKVEDIVIGNPDASVEVIEYASFTCPHCRTFHEDTFKQLKADYIDTGKIKFVYREVFFDPYGLWAAMVARCAGPEKYMDIADRIYAQQSEWQVPSDPGLTADNLKQIGVEAGMDGAAIDRCLGDRDLSRSLVENYRANAERNGVDSTPTLIINGQKFGNLRYADLVAEIEKAM
ncbi:MAG: DsbA family protein [Pseudomonadota bacterium]